MSEYSAIEKNAFDKKKFMDLLSKYGKDGIAAGVLAAGLGTMATRMKQNKDRDDSKDIKNHKNAITVYIDKDNFLSELQTPEEFAKSKAGFGDIGFVHNKAASSIESSLDFFSKKANSKSESEGSGSGVPTEDKASDKKDNDNGSEKPVVLRDSKGRFASPTDPIAVESEKTAEDGFIQKFWNTVKGLANPSETINGMIDAATIKPLAMAGGLLTSAVVASKLVDAVKKIREDKAKERVNAARDKYVNMLESGAVKKVAQVMPGYTEDDNLLSKLTGVGSALVVLPAVISAIVTNKVLENRKKAAKINKSMSGSFPEEPYILYTTVDNKKMPISPETALASMSVKRAMIEKEGNPGSYIPKVSDTVKNLQNAANDDFLYRMVRRSVLGGPKQPFDPMPISFRDAIVASKQFQDLIVNRFENPKYKNTFGKLRDEIVSNEVGRMFRKGSFLHNLMSHFGNLGFINKLRAAMQAYAAPAQVQTPAPAATTA